MRGKCRILAIAWLFVGAITSESQSTMLLNPTAEIPSTLNRPTSHFIYARLQNSDTPAAKSVSGKELNREVSVDQYCNNPAGRDQSCFANAVAALPPFGGKIIVPAHVYTFSAGISITKPVNIECSKGAVIQHDGSAAIQTFVFNGSASGSKIMGSCDFEPVSRFTILSPKSFPTGAYPVLINRGDGVGYQPTSNDGHIYASLTPQQKKQDIGPFILFQDLNDIEVTGVIGTRITIWVTSSSSATGQRINLHDNNFVGGKGGFYGCLGVIGRSGYSGSGLSKVTISRNVVRDCSFSGIFIGNTDGTIIDGNHSFNNGESGIKTFDFPHHPNTHWIISNNTTFGEYYDGIDASAEPAHKARDFTYGAITGNHTYGNNQTGITTDGIGNTVSGNESSNNGTTGIIFDVANGVLSDNVTRDNNTSRSVSGVAEISIGLGSGGNTVVNNRMTHSNGAPGAAGFFATSNADTYAFNIAAGSRINFAGGMPLAAHGNRDDSGPNDSDAKQAFDRKITSSTRVISPRVGINGDPTLTVYMDNAVAASVLAQFTPSKPIRLEDLQATGIQAPNGCSVQPKITIEQPRGTIKATLTLTNFAGATQWAATGLSADLTTNTVYVVFAPGTRCSTSPSGVNFNVRYKIQ